MSNRKIRILLADDHLIIREGIRVCLSDQPNLSIVGEAGDGWEAIEKAHQLKPDVVLMDINMPRLNGLEATERLQRELPQTKVLILTVHNGKEYVARMMQSGAHGYVIKDTLPEELIRAIESIHAGGVYLTPEIAAVMLDKSGSPADTNARSGIALLSQRERECLILVAQGLSSKAISTKWGVGLRTVETHREHIAEKLKIRTIAGWTRLAIEEKLLPPADEGESI